MLLADFKQGYKGNWQKHGQYPSENYYNDLSTNDGMNLYDPAGYGTGSYGYYPPSQKRPTTYKLGADGVAVYGTDGYGGHNNIGLNGYSTRVMNNDVMAVGDRHGNMLPHYRNDSYGLEDTVPRKGDAYTHGVQQWLRGKETDIKKYADRYKQMFSK